MRNVMLRLPIIVGLFLILDGYIRSKNNQQSVGFKKICVAFIIVATYFFVILTLFTIKQIAFDMARMVFEGLENGEYTQYEALVSLKYLVKSQTLLAKFEIEPYKDTINTLSFIEECISVLEQYK